MAYVDEETIQADFLSNNQDWLAKYRNAHYYQCPECHEWFDELDDISQDRCEECWKIERQQERGEDERAEYDPGDDATLKFAKQEMFGDDADMLDDDMGAK